MPGTIGSSCARNCFANFATFGLFAVVVYGFDCPIEPDTSAPGYSTRMPLAPGCARVTSQALWKSRSEYIEPSFPNVYQGRELSWTFSFTFRPAPSCVIAVTLRGSKPAFL